MALFRRCQRLSPLLSAGYKPTSLVSIRNGSGGGFPRGAWNESSDLDKFPKPKEWGVHQPGDGVNPSFPFFIRWGPDLQAKRPPMENMYLFWTLIALWMYGLWYNSRHGPHH